MIIWINGAFGSGKKYNSRIITLKDRVFAYI